MPLIDRDLNEEAKTDIICCNTSFFTLFRISCSRQGNEAALKDVKLRQPQIDRLERQGDEYRSEDVNLWHSLICNSER